jgi:DNA invertase Pin-like site-specific DNA recombinase
MPSTLRAAVYLRVSTDRQDCENQNPDLERYIEARGWTLGKRYTDSGISGATERRPALDELVKDARRRRFDVLVVWRLDRLGRNLRHLVLLVDELTALGIAFVTLAEGIDATTPAGKLQLHILAAIAEFERARVGERVRAAHQRARAAGRHIGRPRNRVTLRDLAQTDGLSIRAAAKVLGVSAALVHRLRAERSETPTAKPSEISNESGDAPNVASPVHEHVTL